MLVGVISKAFSNALSLWVSVNLYFKSDVVTAHLDLSNLHLPRVFESPDFYG